MLSLSLVSLLNQLTRCKFDFMGIYSNAPSVGSYFHQLDIVIQMIGYKLDLAYFKTSILKTDSHSK